MYFGLFPKISTPVEKAVENRASSSFTCVSGRFMAVFPEAKPQEGWNSKCLRALGRLRRDKSPLSVGESLPKARFASK